MLARRFAWQQSFVRAMVAAMAAVALATIWLMQRLIQPPACWQKEVDVLNFMMRKTQRSQFMKRCIANLVLRQSVNVVGSRRLRIEH